MRSTPKAKEVGEAIARLPRVLAQCEHLSIYTILKESGYFEEHNQIDKDLLSKLLSDDKSLIDDWLEFSSNKRTRSGWYFSEVPLGYVVGLITESGRRKNEHVYTDPIEACAEFIKGEIEEIRQLQ